MLNRLVTSSCVLKYGEGAGFPFQVEALEDGVDDTVHAFNVHKADHGASSPSHLNETAFDNVRRPQLLPQMPGEAEERQQLGQIAFQLPHHGAVQRLPAAAESAEGGFGLAPAVRAVEGLPVGFTFL